MHGKHIRCKRRPGFTSVYTLCQQIHTSWGTDISICLNLWRERPRPKQNCRRSCSLSEMALCRKKTLFAMLKHLHVLPSCFSYTFKTRLLYRRVQAELNTLKHKQFSPQEQPQISMCVLALSLKNSLRWTPNYAHQQFARERLLKPFIAIQVTKGCPSVHNHHSLAYQSTPRVLRLSILIF